MKGNKGGLKEIKAVNDSKGIKGLKRLLIKVVDMKMISLCQFSVSDAASGET